ncbi:MAG: H+transporting two-sector ATPase C (AC39) subunit, partial [Thermovirga lienii]
MLLKKYEENYGYFNARLRARMEFFLKKEDYERLASGSLGEFETFIMEGQFGKNYREELLKSGYSTGRRIDEALARGVSDNFQKIKTFAVGEPRLLLELLFMRSDLHNGRLLLRALKTKSNATQPPPKWYGFGALPASLFEDLYASRSNKEIIGKLFLDGHRIATSLAKAVIELEQTGNLPQAERRYLS